MASYFSLKVYDGKYEKIISFVLYKVWRSAIKSYKYTYTRFVILFIITIDYNNRVLRFIHIIS